MSDQSHDDPDLDQVNIAPLCPQCRKVMGRYVTSGQVKELFACLQCWLMFSAHQVLATMR